MAVNEKLKQLQADTHALFVKLHNYHWHVKGLQFQAIHERTETMYEKMAELFDDTAERVLQLGGQPYITQRELMENTRIEEETGTSFTPQEVLEGVIGDYEFLLREFRDLAGAADDQDDSTTVAMAEDVIAELEETLWMLRASLG